jgi:DNA sulfur modification protein DndB
MMTDASTNWRTAITVLRQIDWSRTNKKLWEGRALVNGRINRSRTSVLLTAELISRSIIPGIR